MEGTLYATGGAWALLVFIAVIAALRLIEHITLLYRIKRHARSAEAIQRSNKNGSA